MNLANLARGAVESREGGRDIEAGQPQVRPVSRNPCSHPVDDVSLFGDRRDRSRVGVELVAVVSYGGTERKRTWCDAER